MQNLKTLQPWITLLVGLNRENRKSVRITKSKTDVQLIFTVMPGRSPGQLLGYKFVTKTLERFPPIRTISWNKGKESDWSTWNPRWAQGTQLTFPAIKILQQNAKNAPFGCLEYVTYLENIVGNLNCNTYYYGNMCLSHHNLCRFYIL